MIKFLNVKAAHLKLQYLSQIVIKFIYFSSFPREGRYYFSRKFERQILNISRVIMSEMWKIDLFKNPRKMALCVFCIY